MTHRFLILAVGIGILPAGAACGGDTPTNPETAANEGASFRAMPGDPGDASDRLFYKVNLRPAGDSRAVGVVLIDVAGGYLRVRVHATGVEPGKSIPQHIHVNPGCNPGGVVLVNLDVGLTVPGEGLGTGDAYPVANQAGVLNYEATRSLDDLRSALNTFGGATLEDTAELLDFLDLEDRNAHLHVHFGPPFPAVTCGEVERIN